MKPLLFLDVDGVLNCFSAPETHCLRTLHGVTYIPAGTKERLHRVLPHYDPVWATAWRGTAHGHFRRTLGLSRDSWPVLDWAALKLPSIVRYAAGRPWAWVDDDAEWELRQLHSAFAELPASLIVEPHGDVGLTDDHVTTLVEFAERSVA